MVLYRQPNIFSDHQLALRLSGGIAVFFTMQDKNVNLIKLGNRMWLLTAISNLAWIKITMFYFTNTLFWNEVFWNFPFKYIVSHQIRIVALYILLLFATLYGKTHDFSMERCMQRTVYEWSALFRKMSSFKLDSPKRNRAPFSLKWNPPRKPSSRGNFPFMYILYRFLIVQIRIVALLYTPVICNALWKNPRF